MRKSIAVLALAGAFGTLFADNGPEVVDWFTAIGDNPSYGQLNPVNGAWTITPGTDGSAGFENGKLVLELGADGAAVFAATDGTAPDTNTITRVTLTTTFEPLAELPDSSDGDANLVVFDGAFYVWDGGNWRELTGITVPEAGVETDVLAEIKYQGEDTAREICFTIGEGNDVVTTGWIALHSTENAFANVTIKGAVTLDNIFGKVEMGRAANDGIKYSTIADAMAAASEGSDKTVVLIRNSSESITAVSGVKIDFNKKDSGVYTASGSTKIEIAYGNAEAESTASNDSLKIPLRSDIETVEEAREKIVVTVNDESKEAIIKDISAAELKIQIRTSKEVLANVKPGGKALADREDEGLRKYLSAWVKSEYEKAHTTASEIEQVFQEPYHDGNGLPIWQNYVLGVERPIDPITPVAAPAGDTDKSHITLSVPAISKDRYSGDYKITYKVGNVEASDPQAIKVPLGTGNYEIQAVLSEPDPAPAEPTVGE